MPKVLTLCITLFFLFLICIVYIPFETMILIGTGGMQEFGGRFVTVLERGKPD